MAGTAVNFSSFFDLSIFLDAFFQLYINFNTQNAKKKNVDGKLQNHGVFFLSAQSVRLSVYRLPPSTVLLFLWFPSFHFI